MSAAQRFAGLALLPWSGWNSCDPSFCFLSSACCLQLLVWRAFPVDRLHPDLPLKLTRQLCG